MPLRLNRILNLRRALLLVLVCAALSATPAIKAATPAEAAALRQARRDRTAYTLPPEKLTVAVAYTSKRITLEFADAAWGIVQLVLLLFLGAAVWMRRAAVGASRNRWAQCFIFFFLLLAITTLLSLPLEIYGHHAAVVYGQSVQGWGSWFADQAKSFALTYVVGGLLVMLLFYVIGRSPKRWWFWFWVPTMLFVVFGTFIQPIFIDPLFYSFEPLRQSDPALVDRLERVVARGGIVIPPGRMFLMKASEKVTGLNAYVTGIGASKRVVVWDTTIAKATPDEISMIFGHEMGHYVLNHIYKGIAFAGVLLFVLFWLGDHAVQWLLKRFGSAWGISNQQDWAALLVFMLVLSVLSFLADPIFNGFSRSIEHEADVYGLEAVHGVVADPPATGRRTFQLLGEDSLVDPTPRPFAELWFSSHPPIAQRAAFAAAYNPWAPGQQPKYFPK